MKKISDIQIFTLENEFLHVEIGSIGAAIFKLIVKDEMNPLDIVLGYDNLKDYFTNPGNHGVVIGRNANRIENAEITIANKTYQLEKNDGNNNLHSGSNGLAKRLFDGYKEDNKVILTTRILSLSDGFPGNLSVKVIYELNGYDLKVSYEAVSDQDTIINLCNHSYFNLNGHDHSTIYDHTLFIHADHYMPNNKDNYPTKEILNVKDTPYDFTRVIDLGTQLKQNYAEIIRTQGIDNNYLINYQDNHLLASLHSDQTNITLEILSDQNSMHVYTANHFPEPLKGKGGISYPKHGGIAFETQFAPNSVNMPWLKSPLKAADELFTTYTIFRISKN